MADAIIQTNELTKIYKSIVPGREHVALDRLTMDVPEGQIFGFLGPNGAGKTTTLKLLLGLAEPTSGTGTVLESEIGDTETHQRIGYLSENAGFYDYLEADEYIQYCAKFFGLGRKERRHKSAELLEYVGLGDHTDERLSSFSKGMLQRVGLAQALINDPDLLLLDEPMSGLDPIGRKNFKDLLRSACRDEGKTVFFCSHVLAEVEQVCDHVAILADGRLLTQDRLDELLYLDEVVFTVAEASDDIIEDLRTEGCTIEQQGENFQISVTGDEKAEQIRSMLKQSGARCLKEETRTESLEEFFVRSISELQGETADA